MSLNVGKKIYMQLLSTFKIPEAFQLKDLVNKIREQLARTKILHITSGLSSEAEISEFYTLLAQQLGDLAPMEENLLTGNKTGDLWTGIEYNPNIENSYRHSNSRQPLHTDGAYEKDAPNISFLYCLQQAEVGGATVFIDSSVLLELLQKYDPALYQRLNNTPVRFSKGEDGKTKCVITRDESGSVLTWNYFRATSCADESLIEDFHDFLEQRIVPAGILIPVNLNKGDAVFFHDERILHGRESFFGMRSLKKGGIRLSVR